MYSSTYFALCFLIPTATAGTIGRVSYGEECNKDIRCDSRNFLTCFNNKCTCLMPETMMFENVTRKCVPLAGERCLYSTVEAERTWTDEVPCISNSICREGICECDAHHYEISNGTCTEKQSHGQTCSDNVMCDSSKYQICGSQQTCSCVSGRLYDEGFNMCLLPAGEHCENSGNVDCVTNANCEADRNRYFYYVCSCSKGYFKTENGTCENERGLGEPCIENAQCKRFQETDSRYQHDWLPSYLVCNKGQCSCNPEHSMEYTEYTDNFEVRRCGKLIEVECKNGECFPHSYCGGTCRCGSTSYQTVNKTCQYKKIYGMPCSENNECFDPYVCDNDSKECRCGYGEELHPVMRRCVVAPGHSCDNSKSCVPNAACTPDRNGNNKCVCNPGTIRMNSPKRSLYGDLCFIGENGRCNAGSYSRRVLTEDICAPGLKCKNSTCICDFKEHQVYNEHQQHCLTLVGGPCFGSFDCEDENAECDKQDNEQDDDDWESRCRCQTGFVQFGTGCDIPYGQKCSQNEMTARCDRLGPLECSTDEVCTCPNLQMYDKKTMTCKGLHGARCKVQGLGLNSAKDNFCVDGATCQGFRGFETVAGICVCPFGKVSRSNRTCKTQESEDPTTEIMGDEFTPEDIDTTEMSHTTYDHVHDYNYFNKLKF